MKAVFRLFFLLPMLALSLTGCKSSGANKGLTQSGSDQEITINILAEPQALDCRKVRALTDCNLVRMFMEGLTRTDKNGATTLGVAKDYTLSEDRKTYTFHLRESRWSNGDPVTSHDFAYAWKKSLTPDFYAPNANMLYAIKNAQEAKTEKLPLSLVGIEAPDEKTLVVTLSHPTPYFLELISHPIFFPVNQNVDRQNSHWAEKETTYVGNGPFKLSEWKHHNMIVAEKNPLYWDQKIVTLSKVKMVMVSEDTGFKMFNTEELDWDGYPMTNIPVDAIQSLKERNQLHITPALATQWVRVNISHGPFNSKKMRKAFAYAINRQAIVDHIAQGNQIPATGIVPTAMGLQDKPYFEDGNLSLASELFTEACEELGLSTSSLPDIKLLYASTERNALVAQALQSQWREAFGIMVRLEPVEIKVFFDRISQKDYTLSIGNWYADFNDPINFLEVFKTRDVGTNNTNWENHRYTELLNASYQATNLEHRKQILKQSEELLMDELPVIPIFHFTMLYIHDDHLKDVVLTTMGNIDFKWAHLEPQSATNFLYNAR